MHVRAPDFPRPAPIVPFSPSQPLLQQLPESGAGLPQPLASAQPSFGNLPQASWPEVAWINSPPLSMSELRGKVVLIHFWKYTCINWIWTFAENKKSYERSCGWRSNSCQDLLSQERTRKPSLECCITNVNRFAWISL
jgi:hypothetical protein